MVRTANGDVDVVVDGVLPSKLCPLCSASRRRRRTLSDDVPRLTTTEAHNQRLPLRSIVGRTGRRGRTCGRRRPARRRLRSPVTFRRPSRFSRVMSSSQFLVQTVVLVTTTAQFLTVLSQRRLQSFDVPVRVRPTRGLGLRQRTRELFSPPAPVVVVVLLWRPADGFHAAG